MVAIDWFRSERKRGRKRRGVVKLLQEGFFM